jgi:tRNA (mo5U34)-methyltransferase
VRSSTVILPEVEMDRAEPLQDVVQTPEELQAQADALGWMHTIELGNGVVTKGQGVHWHGPETFPEFEGRTVLDIGAWDGFYSFLAERHGATRVVALDHYAWGVNGNARNEYWAQCLARGTLPDHSRDLTDFWEPSLPGRRAFQFAREVLGSKVEDVVGDFTTMDIGALGVFDVVLFLGVLYHLKDPLGCLERVRAVTSEVAVIETEAVQLMGHDQASLLQFHAGNELRGDFGNWYVPTIQALHELCRAAGFSSVRTIVAPPGAPPLEAESLSKRMRRRVAGLPRSERSLPPSANYRAVVHAFV